MGRRSIVDLLLEGDDFHEFRTPRIDTPNTHGTGCTFASAVAAHLAMGHAVAGGGGARSASTSPAPSRTRLPSGTGTGRSTISGGGGRKGPAEAGRYRRTNQVRLKPDVPEVPAGLGASRTLYTEIMASPLLAIGSEPLTWVGSPPLSMGARGRPVARTARLSRFSVLSATTTWAGGPISRVRSVRAAGGEGVRAHRGGDPRALAGHPACAPSPSRPPRGRASQRGHRDRSPHRGTPTPRVATPSSA